MKPRKVRVAKEFAGRRLDVFLSQTLPHLSRSQAHRLIQLGEVSGPARKPSDHVQEGWVFEVGEAPREQFLAPETVPFDILFQDEHIVVVDKPAGVVVHPAAGHPSGTLVQGLLLRVGKLAGLGEPLRPGIVHRLDKNTSGLLVVARTDMAYQSLVAQIAARQATREYLAIVCGHMKETSGEIDANIGRSRSDRRKMTVDRHGKAALTRYAVKRPAGPCDLVRLVLGSGRTHQIRVHLCHIGKPVFGDPTYGGRGGWATGLKPQERLKVESALALLPRQALHASRLCFEHPVSGQKMSLESPMPEDIAHALEILGS